MYRNPVTIIVIAVAMLGLISCSGNGTANPPHFQGDGNNDNGVQGNLLTSYVPSGSFPTGPIAGALPGAPLGTDPAYGTQ